MVKQKPYLIVKDNLSGDVNLQIYIAKPLKKDALEKLKEMGANMAYLSSSKRAVPEANMYMWCEETPLDADTLVYMYRDFIEPFNNENDDILTGLFPNAALLIYIEGKTKGRAEKYLEDLGIKTYDNRAIGSRIGKENKERIGKTLRENILSKIMPEILIFKAIKTQAKDQTPASDSDSMYI